MIREKEITESALHKVKAQKENFGFMDRFDSVMFIAPFIFGILILTAYML